MCVELPSVTDVLNDVVDQMLAATVRQVGVERTVERLVAVVQSRCACGEAEDDELNALQRALEALQP